MCTILRRKKQRRQVIEHYRKQTLEVKMCVEKKAELFQNENFNDSGKADEA